MKADPPAGATRDQPAETWGRVAAEALPAARAGGAAPSTREVFTAQTELREDELSEEEQEGSEMLSMQFSVCGTGRGSGLGGPGRRGGRSMLDVGKSMRGEPRYDACRQHLRQLYGWSSSSSHAARSTTPFKTWARSRSQARITGARWSAAISTELQVCLLKIEPGRPRLD